MFSHWLRPLVRVGPGEVMKVALSSLHFFLILLSYHFLKPARSAIVLAEHGSTGLPKVYFATAAVVTLVVLAYNRCYPRFERDHLLAGSVLLFAASLGVSWLVLRAGWGWVPAAFYVWVACLSVVIVNQFWSFCNDLYDSRQAKRLYAFITVWGEVGAVLGSFLSARLAPALGTENLVLLAVACLIPVAFLIPLQHRSHAAIPRPPVPADTGAGVAALLRGSRNLRLIATLVLGVMFTGSFIDYTFIGMVERSFSDMDSMTSYFGLVYGAVSLAALAVQLGLTSRLQRGLGIEGCLWLFPAACLAAAGCFLARPALAMMSVLEITFRSLEYSINHTTRELLYLPEAREAKYKAKAAIDMVLYRVGDALGAAAILATRGLWQEDARTAGAVHVGLLGAYTLCIPSARRGYLEALRQAVRARVAAGAPAGQDLGDAVWEDVDRRYALNLACEAALERLPAPAPSLAGGFRQPIQREREVLCARAALLWSPPGEPDAAAAARLLARPDPLDAKLAYEFFDNLLPYALRRKALRAFDPERSPADRAAEALGRLGLGPADVEDHARSLGLGPDEARSLRIAVPGS